MPAMQEHCGCPTLFRLPALPLWGASVAPPLFKSVPDRFVSWRLPYSGKKTLTIFINKKAPPDGGAFLLNKCLALSYFHMATATLSSAQSVFTSEFEMDQVVPARYFHQAKPVAQ